ncbi:MAG: L-aspartate oxidase [Leptospirales bacterium]|nr:L-aspartate oxidase [Leptospirales bacterium]
MAARIDVDFLIIGSGVSGLYAAYLLADLGETLVLTKARMDEASTSLAQGGIASVIAATDSIEKHIQDTLDAGAGLCDPAAVRCLVAEGPEHVRRLVEMGANFRRTAQGELDLGREGGHSENRIVHADDLTGREVERTLLAAVRERGVEIREYVSAVELITRYHLKDSRVLGRRAGTSTGDAVATPEGAPRCFGAYVYDRHSWDVTIVRARAVILATGGAAQVYLHNTNPEVATGDGVALAYRAGAEIANMEFYQFHPTALYEPGASRPFLISEALRGYGARLLGPDLRPFMERYDPRAELAPRDIVARAIDAELKRTGARHVWLDASGKGREQLMGSFPTIFAHCLDRGMDISRDPIPVVPAAHYMCGGVRTDLHGQTCIEGLYVTGEAACTGVHGGNRLASNSLLEGLVFSWRIADCLKQSPPPAVNQIEIKEWQKEGLANAEEWILVQHDFEEIKKVMWDYVGIVRSDLRLNRALRRVHLLHAEIEDFYRRTVIQNKILELRNLALTARLIVQSAMARKESRGLHYSTDYPESRAPSRQDTVLQRRSAEI